MFLFPYRAQIKLHKMPIATIAVALVCLVVYFFQARNEARVEAHALTACTEFIASAEMRMSQTARYSCAAAVLRIYASSNPEKTLASYRDELTRRGDAESAERLEQMYR